MHIFSQIFYHRFQYLFACIAIILVITSLNFHSSFDCLHKIHYIYNEMEESTCIASPMPFISSAFQLAQMVVFPWMIVNAVAAYTTYIINWVMVFFGAHKKVKVTIYFQIIRNLILVSVATMLSLNWKSKLGHDILFEKYLSPLKEFEKWMTDMAIFFTICIFILVGFYLMCTIYQLLTDCCKTKVMSHILLVSLAIEICYKFFIISSTLPLKIYQYCMFAATVMIILLTMLFFLQKFLWNYYPSFESYVSFTTKTNMWSYGGKMPDVLFLGTLPLVLGIIIIYTGNTIQLIYFDIMVGFVALLGCFLLLGRKVSYAQLLRDVQNNSLKHLFRNKVLLIPKNPCLICLPLKKESSNLKFQIDRKKLLTTSLQQQSISHVFNNIHIYRAWTSIKHYFILAWGFCVAVLCVYISMDNLSNICITYLSEDNELYTKSLNIIPLVHTFYFNICIFSKISTYILNRD